MQHKVTLIDLKELRRLIEGTDLENPNHKQYINARWLKYVEWWDSRARKAKWKYFTLRSAVVVGGALIPALVSLRELSRDHAIAFAVASIVTSVVVAISAGMDSLFGFGDIWREKRAAAEVIKSEGFSFLQLIGPYEKSSSHEEAFKPFAANVEQLIRNEIKDYVLAVSPKPDKKP